MANPLLILFPGALGDFLCLWPALEMLRHRATGQIAVAIKSDLHVLLPAGDFLPVSIERHEVADLFAAQPLRPETPQLFGRYRRVHSWTGHGDANFAARLRRATGGIVSVHHFRGMRNGEHAARYYGRCLKLEPPPAGLDPAPVAKRWAARFRRSRGLGPRTLIVHAGSGGKHKNWEGAAAVAAWWHEHCGGNVLLLAGPAENDPTTDFPAATCLRCAPLDRVAALLQQAYLYLGNDSGISHLAGAVGARGVVLFGPTDPATWRPYGNALRVLRAPATCVSCAPNRFCTHRLPVRAVCDALAAMAEQEPPAL